MLEQTEPRRADQKYRLDCRYLLDRNPGLLEKEYASIRVG